ncbi:hypothetical protein DFA_02630 [Cavenderia fasciculata]|uniref:Uncharacterized protein n=1 Tax=Cavenderia fasciculata TaxID=261658 RepID=F4PZX7_CACFS|nr:uncharacterized protein DFA_02630 [Cavenderia fasciculata]EGG18891.1 hypothetical protein DFA_02630 [Cavenderia fasciculata]|eukprot:XP_004357353.1 hypothetical protein DFA_02630 [Cavenderia fasciculata]
MLDRTGWLFERTIVVQQQRLDQKEKSVTMSRFKWMGGHSSMMPLLMPPIMSLCICLLFAMGNQTNDETIETVSSVTNSTTNSTTTGSSSTSSSSSSSSSHASTGIVLPSSSNNLAPLGFLLYET